MKEHDGLITARMSRRGLLTSAGLGITATVLDPFDEYAAAAPHPEARVTPSMALRLLMAGNRRWVTGRAKHPEQSIRRRRAVRNEQHPFATVVSCIDSRVPPELVFDRGIGDLVVIRTGAQVLDKGVVLGSIEFSPDHLGTPLVLVMGHQRCGAVGAAIHTFEHGGHPRGHIQAIVNALRPAYRVAVKQNGDLVDNMVRAQTRLAVARLRADPVINSFIARGRLRVAGGYYSLDTGQVSIIA